VTSGGCSFNDSPENLPTKFRSFYTIQPKGGGGRLIRL